MAITHQLPRPDCCDNCGSPNIGLYDNIVVYGKSMGKWSLIWYCRSCKAAVSCHPNTDIPTGKMADAETRSARGRAHNAFDQLWKKRKYFTRSGAYDWLAKRLNISAEDCHISRFDYVMCESVIEVCKELVIEKKSKSKGYIFNKGRRIKNGKSSRKNASAY